MKTYRIAASILSADFSQLGAEVNRVMNAGADWIHIDVMDNHYVPNLTMGPMICRSLRKAGINAFFDVHLMVQPVDELIHAFADAGADLISIHPQASQHLDRSLSLIHQLGIKSGLALNPATPLSYLDHVMDKLDLILLMSVNPGFGGQQFIPSTMAKIRACRQLIDNSGQEIYLEVDGGINPHNIAELATAGADTFVTGSALFNSENYEQTIQAFRKQLTKDTS